MTNYDANKIANLLNKYGFECEIKEDYSARGMYGKTTTALIVENSHDVAWAMGKLGYSNPHFYIDSLGNDTICY